jgi:hypothetical protein
MKMTRKEKITKILDKYWIRRGWIESDESMVEARPLTAKEELADAILALPIDAPSEEEIEEFIISHPDNTGNFILGAGISAGFKVGAKWAIEQTIKRTKTE